jgi:hypothetical protein
MPGIIRLALRSFDDFEGTAQCSKDELIATAGEIGTMFKWIIDEPVDGPTAKQRFEEIAAAHPAAVDLISRKFMLVLTGIFATWLADVKPKSDDDAEIPTMGMDSIVDYLLSEHTYAACECGCMRFSVNSRPKGALVCDSCGKPVKKVKADGTRKDA